MNFKTLNFKLNAFTLIELMVSMLVSSIALGLIYSGYELISKQFKSYKTTNEIVAEAVYLNALIGKDFSKARNAKRNGDFVELNDYNNQLTIYEFTEEFIMRKVSFSTDTFYIPIKNLSFSILGTEIFSESSSIDEFSFDIKINKEVQVFHYKKQYDAAFLMEREQQLAN